MAVSRQRRRETIDALRAGTVPKRGLDLLAVGMDRFALAVDSELDSVRSGSGVLKAVRGEYGSGKTFFARWLQERAKRAGFAVAEVQISETETPLHRLETVYRLRRAPNLTRLCSLKLTQGVCRESLQDSGAMNHAPECRHGAAGGKRILWGSRWNLVLLR